MNKGSIQAPTNAIVAVTLNCNSRCVMCNIWQNRIKGEMNPEDYLRLPSSLRDINISGGEPFLRMDLPEVVSSIKQAAPRARLILNTNGYLPKIIERQIPKLLRIDRAFAVRVSLDGWDKTHDAIRRIPGGFSMIMETLGILRKAGVTDLGISFTIMKKNLMDLRTIFEFTRSQKLELSLTMVTSSPIYFGEQKENLRPDKHGEVEKIMNSVIIDRYRSWRPKEWFRGWFEQQLLSYYLKNRRPHSCDAGTNFFYLDSVGNVFPCNIKNWMMGNLVSHTFDEIWKGEAAKLTRSRVSRCRDCWMICTAKTTMRSKLLKVTAGVMAAKLRQHLKQGSGLKH